MKRLLKKLMPTGVKLWLKEEGARLIELPYSRSGLPRSLVQTLPPKKPIVLVDVGASKGDFTSSVEKYCGIRKALLVEPQPKRVEELKTRFTSANFHIAGVAAATERRTVDMELLNWDYSSSLLPIRRDMADAYGELDIRVREEIMVETASLDELCEEFTGNIDLLKIDVQGAEHQVLLGATRTLPRVSLVWMEVSLKPLYEGSETLDGMNRLCNEHGFVLSSLEEGWHSSSSGELLQCDALFVRSV